MKYLQDNDGNILQLSEEFQIFKRLVVFTNFSISGDFSTDFEVPNNSETRRIMGYYGLNQIEKLIQKPFHFYIDGNKTASGRVFVRSVSDTFDLFFIGGNGNWMNQIQGQIKDLDLSQYDTPLDYAHVLPLLNSTEGIIFPVVDFAYNNKKLSNYWHLREITGVGQDGYTDFYACFHAKSIMQGIADHYGYLLEGNLLEDTIYNSLVITAESIKSSNYTAPSPTNEFMVMNEYRLHSASPVEMVSGSALFDSGTSSLILPANVTSGTATLNVTLSTTTPGGVTFNIRRFTGIGIIMASQTFSVTAVPTEFSITFALTAMNSGDRISVTATAVDGGTFFTIHEGRVDFTFDFSYVYVADILPDIAQIDFIKYIAQRFNCLIEFEDETQTLTFTKLDSINRLNAVDMSARVSRVVQVPASGYSELNYLRLKEAPELFNYKANGINFGEGVILSDGDGAQDVIETPFAPSETFTNLQLDWLLTNVPFIRLEDADDGIPYATVTNSGGAARFDNALFNDYIDDSVVRVESTSGAYSGYGVIEFTLSTGLTLYGVAFGATDSGRIYKQKIVYQNIGARELIVTRNLDVNLLNVASQAYGSLNLRIQDSNAAGTIYPVDNISFAYFCKPNIGTGLDNSAIGLNYGDVLNSDSIPFSSAYHKNLVKIIQGSSVKAYMLLTSVQYKAIDFKKFVFLRTVDFSGYFLIENVGGYTNQYTEVEIDLIYMDNG